MNIYIIVFMIMYFYYCIALRISYYKRHAHHLGTYKNTYINLIADDTSILITNQNSKLASNTYSNYNSKAIRTPEDVAYRLEN